MGAVMMREKRTRKTGCHKPRTLELQLRINHNISCEMIEREKKKPNLNLPKPKKMTRWSSGFCKLCGEHMDCMTHYHAGLHGFNSAEDFIKAGMYAFD